jgi:broad specificity phosphatase PhoE
MKRQTNNRISTTTWIIRHAESEANAGGPTDSPHNIRLTDHGHQQAIDLAAKFATAPDLIVISTFLRTHQTAGPLIKRFPHLPVEAWPVHEFTYLNPGLYPGTTESQRAVFVETYWKRCDPRWNDGGGAESFTDFMRRVDDFSQHLQNRPEAWIAIFTHGYFIQALRLRRQHPSAKVDEALMAAFRDQRRDNPPMNAEILDLKTRIMPRAEQEPANENALNPL